MRSSWWILPALVAALPATPAVAAVPAIPLRVTYVGKPETERARQYLAFLKGRFAHAAAADRDRLDRAAVAAADVVVLDWSQADAQEGGRFEFPYPERALKSPLGRRDGWTKPTVLLGSAGHLLAACWEVHGGSG
jgi:hypothetical protein